MFFPAQGNAHLVHSLHAHPPLSLLYCCPPPIIPDSFQSTLKCTCTIRAYCMYMYLGGLTPAQKLSVTSMGFSLRSETCFVVIYGAEVIGHYDACVKIPCAELGLGLGWACARDGDLPLYLSGRSGGIKWTMTLR